MSLHDRMPRDAVAMTRLSHHGEEVIYLFKSGGSRAVQAIVHRLDVERGASNVPQVARLRAMVEIPRDAAVGVTAFVPGDRLKLSMRLGDAPVTTRACRLVGHDHGMFQLEVEA